MLYEAFGRKFLKIQFLMAGAVLLAALLFGSASMANNVYTFESLQTNGLIHTQDNWVDQPGQGYAAILLDQSAANGTKVVWSVPTTVFNQSAFLTRVNDANFSFSPVTAIQTHLTVQFDCTGEHVAMFALGHDRNGDGMLLKSDGEIGPSFGSWDQHFRIQGANVGTAHDAPFGNGNSRKDWYRIQLSIDFTAKGGEGSGSLLYKNLSDGDPEFIVVSELQDIDLELSSMHPDAGPTSWNAMWIHLLSGGGNDPSADNLIPVEDATFCQLDIGYGGPGDAKLSLCGGDLSSGTTADLLLTGTPAGTPALLIVGTQLNPTPFAGGFIVPVPFIFTTPFVTDAGGKVFLPGIPGGGGPATLFIQFLYEDAAQPAGLGISNGLQVEFLP
jgi:hypothetical protein